MHTVAALLEPLKEPIAEALAAVLCAALIALCRRLHISIDETRLRARARDACLYAEEWAAKKAGDAIAPLAEAKFQVAADFVKRKFPSLSDPAVDDLIHAAVADLQLGKAAERAESVVVAKIQQTGQKVADAVTETLGQKPAQ